VARPPRPSTPVLRRRPPEPQERAPADQGASAGVEAATAAGATHRKAMPAITIVRPTRPSTARPVQGETAVRTRTSFAPVLALKTRTRGVSGIASTTARAIAAPVQRPHPRKETLA